MMQATPPPHPAAQQEHHAFRSLQLPASPVMLAPLAGVSDYPFRSICAQKGAHLTYVEMLSAIALSYHSKNTMATLHRHHSEQRVGVQVTARGAEEMARGVSVLAAHPFDTIDVNMGCPVKKVVKTGCGSALLRDPEKVYQVVRAARQNCPHIISAKIRLGWSTEERHPLEVAQAAEEAGAAWLTVHGRLRSDRYSAPVDLAGIKAIKEHISIPVVGNGNLFTHSDIHTMKRYTGVDGVMISRGALGNPWVFQSCAPKLTPRQWHSTVREHILTLRSFYGNAPLVARRFRKNLLWYLKGWPTPSSYRQAAQHLLSLEEALKIIHELRQLWEERGYTRRLPQDFAGRWILPGSTHPTPLPAPHNTWDPKYDMHRQWDRGVGEEDRA